MRHPLRRIRVAAPNNCPFSRFPAQFLASGRLFGHHLDPLPQKNESPGGDPATCLDL